MSVFAALFGAQHVFAMSLNFSASNTQISAGQEVILSWSTNSPAALHCLINDASGGFGSGSTKVSPKVSTNYTIICEYWLSNGSNYDSATRTITININGTLSPAPNNNSYPPTTTPTPTPYFNQTYTQLMNVACATSPASPKIGDLITFAAASSGGAAPYTYSWSGAVSGSGQSVSTSFAASGSKTATVISKDALGRSAQSSCSVNVTSDTTNTSNSVSAPTPTPTTSKPAGETGKVEGVSTVCKQVTVCFDQNTGKITETETLPTPSGVVTPTPTKSVVGASPSISKNSSKSSAPSLFASLFNIKGDVGGKIKSLAIWYVVILLVILLIVLSYMGIKKIKNKKEEALLDQQNRKT